MSRKLSKSIIDRLGKAGILPGILLLPALAGSSWLLAQEHTPASADELEEIIVVAPRSFTSMRAEIVRAEERALDLYNTLNDDDDYDIRCSNDSRLSSHFTERVCRPMYVIRMEARAAQDFMDFGIAMGPVENAAQHERVMRQKMAELSNEHPALLEALQDYYDAKTTYDDARAERFGSDQD